MEHVAARLPLTIICQLMGIPDDSYAMVLRNTNVILSGMDPDLISEDMNEAVGQILAAGAELGDLVTSLGNSAPRIRPMTSSLPWSPRISTASS